MMVLFNFHLLVLTLQGFLALCDCNSTSERNLHLFWAVGCFNVSTVMTILLVDLVPLALLCGFFFVSMIPGMAMLAWFLTLTWFGFSALQPRDGGAALKASSSFYFSALLSSTPYPQNFLLASNRWIHFQSFEPWTFESRFCHSCC